MTSKVIIYTKDDCHLCQKAKEKLKGLQGEFDFLIEEVDITKDAELYLKYKESIPVVEIDDEIILKAPFGEFRLRRALESRRPSAKRNLLGIRHI
ncbi:MAG: glutaredoxin family protein [Dehalococcoidia bacterium]